MKNVCLNAANVPGHEVRQQQQEHEAANDFAAYVHHTHNNISIHVATDTCDQSNRVRTVAQ